MLYLRSTVGLITIGIHASWLAHHFSIKRCKWWSIAVPLKWHGSLSYINLNLTLESVSCRGDFYCKNPHWLSVSQRLPCLCQMGLTSVKTVDNDGCVVWLMSSFRWKVFECLANLASLIWITNAMGGNPLVSIDIPPFLSPTSSPPPAMCLL